MTTEQTQVEFDPNATQVAEHAPQSEGYWNRVWLTFNKRLINRLSMWMLMVFGTLYVAADLIANGSPLLLSYQGGWYSPWLQREGCRFVWGFRKHCWLHLGRRWCKRLGKWRRLDASIRSWCIQKYWRQHPYSVCRKF